MKLFIFICLFMGNAFAGNLGHRAGGGKGEFYETLPENSIEALVHSIQGGPHGPAIQLKEDYVYLEFDVQETKDHRLIVFHDKVLYKKIPNTGKNVAVYQKILAKLDVESVKDLKVHMLTFNQIRSLHLKGHPDKTVPTLQEMMDAAEKYGLRKPMAIEVKSLFSDVGRNRLLQQADQFNRQYMQHANIIFERKYDMPFKVGFIAFRRAFKKSFGKSKAEQRVWCDKAKVLGLYGFFKTRSHNNMCP